MRVWLSAVYVRNVGMYARARVDVAGGDVELDVIGLHIWIAHITIDTVQEQQYQEAVPLVPSPAAVAGLGSSRGRALSDDVRAPASGTQGPELSVAASIFVPGNSASGSESEGARAPSDKARPRNCRAWSHLPGWPRPRPRPCRAPPPPPSRRR